MTHEELLRTRTAIFNSKEWHRLSEVLADDVVVHLNSDQTLHGREELAALVAGFDAIPFQVELLTVLVEGDQVATRYVVRGTHEKAFMGFEATGRPVSWEASAIHRIENGRIAETWTIEDFGAIMAQLSAPPPTERTDETKALVARWVELANARDYDGLGEIWADDLVVHQNTGGDVHGFAAFRALLESYFAAMPDLHIEVLDLVGDGDTVVMHSMSSGTHTGELFGVPASGKAVRFRGLGTYRVKAGRIVEEWFNDDITGLMQQIGTAASASAG